MATEKKKAKVVELAEKLQNASAVYFTDYQGLSVDELSNLRTQIKSADADYIVVKNALFSLALNGTKLKETASDVQLTGPTAVIFAYSDELGPLQAFAEEHKDRLKAALAFGEYLTGTRLGKLAELEPEEQLRAKLVSNFAAPMYALAYSLNWNLQRLATAINAIQSKRSSNEG